VKKAEEHGSYILSDEIMGDFSLFPSKNKNTQINQKFISLSSFSYKNIIVGNSISKVFNCESVQGGYGIIRDSGVR
jgi:bifunctional pyridoxal-dependent enzyme with beta-cystathionase and maltose regulon repressor activities